MIFILKCKIACLIKIQGQKYGFKFMPKKMQVRKKLVKTTTLKKEKFPNSALEQIIVKFNDKLCEQNN